MNAWLLWMKRYYSERHTVPGYSNYEADRCGNIFKDGQLIKPFNSSGYKQICLTAPDKHRLVKGVHQVVSMTFDPSYYKGCVVHHRNENKHDNNIFNLEVQSVSAHARHHVNPAILKNWIKQHGSPTKGMKMSDEFREHCRQAAQKRKSCGNGTYNGNQFRNADGSKKTIDPEWYQKFRESCRQGALKRKSK